MKIANKLSGKWAQHAFAGTIIIALGIIAFGNSTHGEFHYDDIHTIVENSFIRSPNPLAVWTTNNHFRFLGFYSFALNYHFNGLRNMAGWHLVNIALHIACAIILYITLYRLTRGSTMPLKRIPLIASIIFVSHPLCSEPVNYIQARHVLFYSLFSLLGLLCADIFLRSKTSKSRIISALGILLCITCSALSKEIGIYYSTAYICLYIFFFHQTKENAFRKGFIVLSLLPLLFFTISANYRTLFLDAFKTHYNENIGSLTLITNVLTQAKVFWKYVLLIVPTSSKLNVDHNIKTISIESPLETAAAIACFSAIIFIFATSIAGRRKHPLLSFFSLWTVMGFLPYMVVISSSEFMVEYKAYLPAIGLFGIIAIGTVKIKEYLLTKRNISSGKIIIPFLVSIIVITCTIQTKQRNLVWKTELSLWEDSLDKSPNNVRAYNSLGLAYYSKGERIRALTFFKKALHINPRYPDTYNNLGITYTTLNRRREAIYSLIHAIELAPLRQEYYYNLANAYRNNGDNGNAIMCYRKAILTNPKYAQAYNNLGAIYHENYGNPEKAIALYKISLEINPYLAESCYNLGKAYYDTGNYEEAVKWYKKTLKLYPAYSEAYYNLAVIYSHIGKPADEIITLYKRAIKNNASYKEAYNNMGSTYIAAGNTIDALSAYKKALDIDPAYAAVYLNLAAFYFNSKQYSLSIQYAEKARALDKNIAPEFLKALEPYRDN